MELKHAKVSPKYFVFMQASILVLSLSGVLLKFSAGYYFLSPGYLLCYTLAIGVLALYAILWQMILRKVPLKMAYGNRATSTIWNLVWGAFIFSETITPIMIVGSIVIMIGVMIMVSEDE